MRPIEEIIAEYKAEYLRVNGKEVEIDNTKSKFFIYIGTSSYRRWELPVFIERLKARPSFVAPHVPPATNILGEQVEPKKLTMMETVVALLQKTSPSSHNEMLMEILPSIPNAFVKDVEFGFSGWNIKLHPDGTWSVKDTGGVLKNT